MGCVWGGDFTFIYQVISPNVGKTFGINSCQFDS